jgi:hypothetical protein
MKCEECEKELLEGNWTATYDKKFKMQMLYCPCSKPTNARMAPLTIWDRIKVVLGVMPCTSK